MRFQFLIHGTPWTVVIPSSFPRIAAATTIDNTSYFESNICPDAISLAHEFYHAMHTSWLRYLWSYTIGRLWHDAYWRTEENSANLYGGAHASDNELVAAAQVLRAALPAAWRTATITHSA